MRIKKVALWVVGLFVLSGIMMAATAEERPATLSVTAGETTDAGEVTVEISLENNPGICALRLALSYDAQKLDLVKAENGTAMGDASYLGGPVDNVPYILTWSSVENQPGNGLMAVLTFQLRGDTAFDLGMLELTYQADDLFRIDQNGDFENVHVSVMKGDTCGHVFDEWHTQVDATCSQKGEQVRTCIDCGQQEKREIPVKEHVFAESKNGEDGGGDTRYTCQVCGREATREEAEALAGGDKSKSKRDVGRQVACGFAIALVVFLALLAVRTAAKKRRIS